MADYPYYYHLRCPIKDYAWGQTGRQAFIPQLLKEASEKPAAELWMGAHNSDPSYIINPKSHPQTTEGIPLDQAIQQDSKHFLGNILHNAGLKRLPFLFKILDAASPLSIQAHPDSQLATLLHKQKPEHYPDPYHKPELAVCLHGMRALVGFRPIAEIQNFTHKYPALNTLCQNLNQSISQKLNSQEWLQNVYANLMQARPEQVEQAARKHQKNIEKLSQANSSKTQEDMLFELFIKHYGLQDAGIFCPYFLNYVELETHQAIFLRPNEAHSYISGVILECMAASDNVVRAGLTRKYQDTQTLLNMLDYKTGKAKILTLQQGTKATSNQGFQSYCLGIPDFSLHHYSLENNNTHSLSQLHYPSILLVLEGEIELRFYLSQKKITPKVAPIRVKLKQGSILLLPGDLAQREISVELSLLKQTQLWRALAGGIPELSKHI